MRSVFIFLIVGIAALLLTACAGAATPEPVNLTIELSEYAFSPAKIDLKVGQEVTFTIVNVGALEHEIMFGREVMMTDGRPSGYMMDMFESAHVEPEVMMETGMEMGDEHQDEEDVHGDDEHAGFMVYLPAGDDKAAMTFTVTEDMVGEWEIGCFELDGVHYDAGMIGTLVVTP
jgi:plastocyanin